MSGPMSMLTTIYRGDGFESAKVGSCKTQVLVELCRCQHSFQQNDQPNHQVPLPADSLVVFHLPRPQNSQQCFPLVNPVPIHLISQVTYPPLLPAVHPVMPHLHSHHLLHLRALVEHQAIPPVAHLLKPLVAVHLVHHPLCPAVHPAMSLLHPHHLLHR